jgi:hypothetical protein
MLGPRFSHPLHYECEQWDADGDGDLDLLDAAEWLAG